ncbi:MAG TPA: hypothetical protein VF190_03695, partial [Rhodothermales bacterium]
MGYSFTIGEAEPHVPTGEELDEDNRPGWTVRGTSHPEAPTFPGDGMTSNTSGRSPSYSGWANFVDEVGLRDLFFGARPNNNGGRYTRDVCLIPEHPGVAILRQDDLLEIRQARERWQMKRWPTEERIAGWDPSLKWNDTREPDPRYDGNLARLLWLE